MTTRTKLTVAIVAICFIVSAVLLNGQSTYVTGATGTFITNAATRLRMTATNLLGRTSAGSGPIQEIAIGSGLVMTNQTLSATGGAGGTTINATDGVIPVRGNATTFTNSPLSTISGDIAFVDEGGLNWLRLLKEGELQIGTNTYAYAGGAWGTSIFGYNNYDVGEDGSGLGMALRTVSTNGLATMELVNDYSNPHISLAAVNEYSVGSITAAINEYPQISISSATAQLGTLILASQSSNQPTIPYINASIGGTNVFRAGSDGSILGRNPAASTNFYAAAASGYTGTATNVLSDNGTYRSLPQFLGTNAATSANLASALTDETGSGLAVFSGNPTLTNVVIHESVGSSGVTINGATQTASTPLVSGNQTWNGAGVTFTGVSLNVTNTASSTNSHFLLFRTNSVDVFRVRADGQLSIGGTSTTNVTITPGYSSWNSIPYLSTSYNGITSAAGVHAGIFVSVGQQGTDGTIWAGLHGNSGNSTEGLALGGSPIGWSSTSGNQTTLFSNRDTYMTRGGAAATVELGLDAATAITQTLKAHDGSGTDKDGAVLQIRGGQSTGSGRSGSVEIGTALTSTTGSTANGYSARFRPIAKFVDLTDAGTNTLISVNINTNNVLGIDLFLTVYATDGTNTQSQSRPVTIDSVNKAGTLTSTVDNSRTNATAASSGTLGYTVLAESSGTTNLLVRVTADSSLTTTTFRARVIVTGLNSDGLAVITEQ